MGKTALASKTIWANLALVSIGVLGYLQGHELIAAHPTAVAIFGILVGIGNMILRLVTSEPIK